MRKPFFALLIGVLLIPTTPLAGEKTPAGNLAGNNARVILRDSATVNSKLVRIGDLFTNTGNKADIAVAYAPVAGKKAFFDANWLYRVARAYDLKWRPLGLQDQVVVERDSQIISRDEIEDHIRAALIDRGVDPTMTVELSNRMLRLYIPGDASARIGVEDVAYEPRTGRFTAILIAPEGQPGATRTRVTGRLLKITDIPVLSRRILANELITKRDIKWIRVHSNRLRTGIVVDASELIGKAAKRGLRPGLPVRANDIQRQILVPKGSLVTIVLKAKKMILTAQGKALEDGSDGDTVRILNTQSNKVIEAEVTGAAKVAVLSTSLMAMN
ncbi:MAG: flagellar basal body P-ring formation chaperone FlgA [Rhodospirillales bacterium]